jgi:pimeloyl-ACP methyl ester carboxylesterase
VHHVPNKVKVVVPALLRHLGIKHVFLGAHSGGTVFALDMLLHHPELLDPRCPYLAIGAPWIHQSHTGTVSLNMAAALPARMIGTFDKLVGFLHSHVEPITSASVGISAPISDLFSKPPANVGTEDDDVKFEEAIGPKWGDRMFGGDIKGVSDEALFLLRRADGMDGWGDWKDYDTLIAKVADIFKQRGQRLTVDVFFSETDAMIGSETGKGPQWFHGLWQSGGDSINYTKEVVSGSDHDSIWNLRWGMAQRVYARIGALGAT